MSLSEKVFSIIKIIGAIYLGYLAFKTWKYVGQTEITGKSNEVSLIKTVQKGIVINLLNPKLTLFFLSFLPQFVPANIENKTYAMILLSLVFMGMTLIIFILYGLLASQASKMVKHNKRIMKTIERGFAIVFASLAVKLALEDK
jgi:threonine/homoserine/homoserine lactone efflux protein